MVEDIRPLVEAWIALHDAQQRLGNDFDGREALFWAYEELDDICRGQPSKAVHIITQVLNSTENEFVLTNLAAGPLEDLLCLHGSNVVDEIERLVKIDGRSRNLLKGVWRNAIDEKTWMKVQTLVKL
jgi:Family of unknown function (DUF6869)